MFQNSPSGHLVPISGSADGRERTHHAFVPDALGESGPELSQAAYRAVAEARAALAALDSTAARLPNPGLFRHASLRLEAQATSELEGTYEPLREVLGVEPTEATSSSMIEVLNYVTVAELAFEWNAQGRPWSVSTFEELHRVLMQGTKGERDFHGVRPIQVVIGRREDADPAELPIMAARYVPPPPGDDLRRRLADLLHWAQSDHRVTCDPVVAAALVHYTFEALHPFHDGNGRLGRLLIVMHLHHLGVLSEPSITVSPWFESRRQRYYDALLGAASAADARARMTALTQVQETLKERVRESHLRSANARLLVDFAVARPTFTVRQVAEALGLQRAGAKKVVDNLITVGVLKEYGHRSYDRRFCAPDVVSILLGSTRGTTPRSDKDPT